MSVALLGNIISKRLSTSPTYGISAAADADSKQRLIRLSQNMSHHPDTCGMLKRAGLAERAVDLAAAGSRFSLSEIDEALNKTPVLYGARGDSQNLKRAMAFKIGLQELGLL